MKKFFLGFLLVLLDFDINIGFISIGLIPDFLGYYCILKGLDELKGKSREFDKVRPLTYGMMIYSIVMYAGDILGANKLFDSWNITGINYVLGLIAVAASLYITYCISKGVYDIECSCNTDIGAGGLNMAWMFTALSQLTMYIAGIVSGIFGTAFLMVFGVITFGCSIWFIVMMYKTADLYEHYKSQTFNT